MFIDSASLGIPLGIGQFSPRQGASSYGWLESRSLRFIKGVHRLEAEHIIPTFFRSVPFSGLRRSIDQPIALVKLSG